MKLISDKSDKMLYKLDKKHRIWRWKDIYVTTKQLDSPALANLKED